MLKVIFYDFPKSFQDVGNFTSGSSESQLGEQLGVVELSNHLENRVVRTFKCMVQSLLKQTSRRCGLEFNNTTSCSTEGKAGTPWLSKVIARVVNTLVHVPTSAQSVMGGPGAVETLEPKSKSMPPKAPYSRILMGHFIPVMANHKEMVRTLVGSGEVTQLLNNQQADVSQDFGGYAYEYIQQSVARSLWACGVPLSNGFSVVEITDEVLVDLALPFFEKHSHLWGNPLLNCKTLKHRDVAIEVGMCVKWAKGWRTRGIGLMSMVKTLPQGTGAPGKTYIFRREWVLLTPPPGHDIRVHVGRVHRPGRLSPE
ncbi:hypothetical protein BJ322DRAFT_1022421 [Thelephora terrestris]|uniref:Uncharacterized protein n=1 Tax=Thelephora terrestris TaxID=56493 RepID=A0A9P6HCK9_9AGAM|nr:hypothetical protein BJ322DRAFT_1022421 [Thelephora terrestris]